MAAPGSSTTRRALAALVGAFVVGLPTVGLAGPSARPPAAIKPTPPKLRQVHVASDGVDPKALVPELRLRRPDLDFDRGVPSRDAAKLDIARASGHQTLTLTTSDGRVYVREVPADDDIGARALAADAVAFLDAVERGDVRPEPRARRARGSKRDDVPLGQRLADALQLGAGLGPSVTLPVARRPSVGAGTFVAGSLILRAQTVRNVVFELSTRVGGKRAAGHRLVRGRIGFGAGYRLTRDIFDMPITGAINIEPWSIRARDSDAEPLEAEAVNLRRPPALIGFGVRAAPAALLVLGDGITVRVGGGVELATAAAPGTGVGAIRAMPDGSDDTALRAGGLEATIMAEIGVWVPFRAIQRKRR